MSEIRKINPLVAIAAISVTVFSLVGIGVMTGVVPSSFSRSGDSTLQTGAPDTATEKMSAETAPASSPTAAPAPAAVSAPSKPRAKAQTRPVATKQPAQQPAQVATTEMPPAPVEQAKAAPVCTSCGVVSSVNAISQKGEGSGLGAIAGGVLGGVLGHQIGGGTGKKIATVAGAAGGAFAGHQVEKNMKSTTLYDVIVNMDDGTTRTFPYDTQPAFQVGAKVRVVNGALTAG